MTTPIDQLQQQLPEAWKQLKPLPAAQIQQLATQHPGLPADYREFLIKIGTGPVGTRLMFYSALEPPDAVYDAEDAADLGPVLLFGDDLSGTCFGFDPTKGWAVVQISESAQARVRFATFSEFLQDRVKNG